MTYVEQAGTRQTAPARTLDLLVVAGEASGDQLAAGVVQVLQRSCTVVSYGAGGARLDALGVRLLAHVDELAVTGAAEALGRAPEALRLWLRIRRELRRARPAAALLVDYPGFNLRLGQWLRGRGVPVLHYGAPQRWAWLPQRARQVSLAADRLAVTLPFEATWFRARGIDAVHVGHPLLDEFRPLAREVACRQLGLDPQSRIVALFPGSRANELAQHLPVVASVAAELARQGRCCVLATSGGVHAETCARALPGVRQASADVALGAADVALCASGTATLEAAIAGVPAAVFYRLAPSSYALARRLVQVPFIALPNLVLGESLLPELIQAQVSTRALHQAVEDLLQPTANARVRARLGQVVQRLRGLGPGSAAERVAGVLAELAGMG